MIPTDPFSFTEYAPFDALSFYVHGVFGVIGLGAALCAFATRKGSAVHIWSGRIFIICIILVSLSAFSLLATRFAPPLLIAALSALYAIATAYLALKPQSATVKSFEYGLFAFQILALLLFLAIAVPNIIAGKIPAIGPAIIAVIPIIFIVGDIRFFKADNRSFAVRIRRHLSRMIWAFVIAVRAPLAEVYAELHIPVAVILIGPLVAAPIMIWFFERNLPAINNDKIPKEVRP